MFCGQETKQNNELVKIVIYYRYHTLSKAQPIHTAKSMPYNELLILQHQYRWKLGQPFYGFLVWNDKCEVLI